MNNKHVLIFIVCFFLTVLNFAQSESIDRLKKQLQYESVDSLKLAILDDLTWEYLYSDIDSARKYSGLAMMKSELLNDEPWIAACHQSLGTIFFQTAVFDSAVFHFEIAKKINERLGLKDRASSNYNGLGNVFLQRGMYKQSLDNYLQAVRLAEETGNRKKSAIIMSNVAIIYHNLHNFEKSLEYNLKSLKIAEELTDSAMISSSFTNIANLYSDADSLDKAEKYHLESLEILHRLNLISRTAQTYTNLALLYKKRDQYSKALKFLNQALELHLQMENEDGVIVASATIGQIYLLEKNYGPAIKYLLDALEKSKVLGVKERIVSIYGNLHGAYNELGDFSKAYEYLLLYSEIRDSMLNSENSKMMAEMQTIYETDKKQKEIELQGARIEKQDTEINKQKILNYSFAGGIAMLLALAFLIFRGYLQKKRAHFEIEKRNLKLQRANAEISSQKEIIEEKNKDILDSIRYAKRIQQAMLPPGKFMKEYLPESFILYKPKDIVAGDFYWMHAFSPSAVEIGLEGEVLIAVADCTGHGVPGAFVSIVANNALNRAVKEFGLTSPAGILDKVNELVEESFAKSESDIKDGMDISLCKLGKQKNQWQLEFAGAYNPMWLAANMQVTEVSADKQPVGKFSNRQPFTNQKFTLNSGDTIYLFSDGYADQFGGPKGKKFKYKQFKELILSIHENPMSDQKIILEKAIEEWQGDLVQIDDICVIGIKI